MSIIVKSRSCPIHVLSDCSNQVSFAGNLRRELSLVTTGIHTSYNNHENISLTRSPRGTIFVKRSNLFDHVPGRPQAASPPHGAKRQAQQKHLGLPVWAAHPRLQSALAAEIEGEDGQPGCHIGRQPVLSWPVTSAGARAAVSQHRARGQWMSRRRQAGMAAARACTPAAIRTGAVGGADAVADLAVPDQ